MSKIINVEPFVDELKRTILKIRNLYEDSTVATTLELVVKHITAIPTIDVVHAYNDEKGEETNNE